MRVLIAAAAMILAITTAHAAERHETPERLTPSDLTDRLIAMVSVSGRTIGDAEIVVAAGDVWLPAAFCIEAGLRWQGGREVTVGDRVLVPVQSLRPRLAARVDTTEATLVLTPAGEAGPAGCDPRSTDCDPVDRGEALRWVEAARQRQSSGGASARSLLVNYAVGAQQGEGLTGSGEASIHAGKWHIRGSATMSGDGRPIRGPLTATLADVRALARLDVGDLIATPSATTAVPIAGISIASDASLDPTWSPLMPLSVAGSASLPSVAETYVDGRLVSRADVPSGPFTLPALAVPAGMGHVSVVLRDAFGRERTLTQTYSRSPRVLAPGVQEYRYALGVERYRPGIDAWAYGSWVGEAEHRVGVTSWLTLGGHAGLLRGGASSDATVAVATRAGAVEFGLGWTSFVQPAHLTTSVDYELRASRVDLAATWRHGESAMPGRLTPVLGRDAQVSLGLVVLPRLSFGLLVADRRADVAIADGPRAETRLGLTVTANPTPQTHFSAIVTPRRGTTSGQALFSLSVGLGERRMATVTQQVGASGSSTGVSLNRSLPVGPGLGYTLATTDLDGTSSAALVAQGSTNRLEVRRDGFAGGAGRLQARVSGAVSLVGGGVHWSRPVDDAAALVVAPGAAGVRAYLNQQYVGRTNAAGELLVPGLVGYAPATIGLDDADVPAGVELPADPRPIVAPRGGVALARLTPPVTTVLVGHVRLVTDDGPIVPAFGELRSVGAAGSTRRSPVARDGSFYLERLVGGAFVLRYHGRDHRCVVTAERSTIDTYVRQADMTCESVGRDANP